MIDARADAFPRRHRWTAAVVLGVAGLVLNLFSVPLSPGTDLVFGGMLYLLAAVALGPWQGLLAAAIASARTVFLWGHPYAWIIFCLEALGVGLLVRRGERRPLVASLLFWVLVGVPLLFATYWAILGVRGETAAVIFLKQPFNGLVNAMAVEALLLIPLVRRAVGVRGRPQLRSALAVVVAIAATLPALAFGVWTGRLEWHRNLERTEERLRLYAEAHAARLEQYVRLHEQSVRAVAEGAERRGDFSPQALQRLISAEHQEFPGFVNLYAADSRARTVAFEPLVGDAGEPLIGLDFSHRDYFRRLRDTRQTVISDVFAGQHGVDEPLIVIAHPIVLSDTLTGYVLGALDLKAMPTPRPAPGRTERMRVADPQGRLIYDSALPYRPGDRPVSVADSAAFRAVAAAPAGAATVEYRTGDSTTPAGAQAARMLAGLARIPSLGWWVWTEQPYAAVQGFVAESYVRLFSLLIAVTLIALAVSDLLSAYLARPLLRMRAAATALAGGDRAARVGPVPATAPAEIAQLGRDFDAMAGALAGRTAELEELGEIARSLASTLEADEVLRRVTDATVRLVHPDGCGIALATPGGALRMADDAQGLMQPSAGAEVPAESLLGLVLRNRRPELVRDAASDPRVPHAWADLERAGSVICAPLVGRSGALGVLCAIRAADGEPFAPADLRLLDRLARQAAVAVENAHLVSSERRRAEESEAIRLVARSVSAVQGLDQTLAVVVREAARIVGADACRVLLRRDGDDAGDVLEVVAVSGASAEQVGALVPARGDLLDAPLTRGIPATVDEGSHAAAVPLRVGDETMGVLTAHRVAAPFGPEDARLLAAFADHAAVALRNARLLEAAQAAARARSDFIATMSHELRTPLNAVLGHLQLLEMEIHGPLTEDQQNALSRIEAASRHLRGLIEEVLSFARLEAGRLELQTEPVDVCALAAEVAAVIEPLALEKALDFRLDGCEPHPVVRTDPDKVRQILINLAGNAVKFTEAGEVSIRVRARPDGVELSVRDTGPGIPEEDQARLFRPFEQLHTGFARPHGGTGLGLYLSGKYAQMLGGTIAVESHPGEGSTFALVLPLAPPATATPRKAEEIAEREGREAAD